MSSEARPSVAGMPCLFRIQAEGWVGADFISRRAIGYHRAATYPAIGDVIVLPLGDNYHSFTVGSRVFAATGEVTLHVNSWDTFEVTKRAFDAATEAAGVEC